MKKFNNCILLVLTIFVLQTGCVFPSGCGTFGYSSSYSSELIIDEPFETINLAVEDTVVLRPSRQLHIDYKYTGNPDCDNTEDYVSGPDKLTAEVLKDSIAIVNVFTEGQDPWGGNEEKVEIIGQNAGDTSLSLKIHWTVEGNEYYHDVDSTLVIGLSVHG